MIDARGAPFDQGEVQGRLLAGRVRARVRELRERLGWLGWRPALADARRSGRAVQRFTPQQHERLQGIAFGARVSVRALELAAACERVVGVGSVGPERLETRLELPEPLARRLVLRTTTPDAGGFPSVELCAVEWSGALAGVNHAGVAMAVVRDHGVDECPIPVLGQDVLLRAETFDAALDHLRLRAAYGGGSGALLICDAAGSAARVDLERGRLRRSAPRRAEVAYEASSLVVSPVARQLVWRRPDGKLETGEPNPPRPAEVRSWPPPA